MNYEIYILLFFFWWFGLYVVYLDLLHYFAESWMKLYIRSIGPSMFEAEALGLGAMYETGTIRVPKPYKVRRF